MEDGSSCAIGGSMVAAGTIGGAFILSLELGPSMLIELDSDEEGLFPLK